MKQNNTRNQAATPHTTEQDLESAAADLDHFAKFKLPDGCLNGILTGYEPDIRQQAVLMALRWWVDHHTGDSPHDWNPRRSVSHALHFTKLQYVEKIEHRRESTYHDEWDARITEHPYRLHEHDYPEQSLLRMFEAILNKCASNGTISTSNALVARMVYIESRTLVEVAKALGVHRSAVSQQLRRVRIAVRDAATTTDPTFLP
jgi:hypothetical protein